ncbi:MAG: DHH family phosphoesterase [Paramuribaculum sp.]|nr:DHH family phosphoesterase [Paramuribaculum sp.]
MLTDIIESDKVETVKRLIEQSRSIAIVCHMTPDGDALGSSLCLWHVLKAMRKRVAVVTPDMIPSSLSFLPGADRVIVATNRTELSHEFITGADLLFCLDFNELRRIDRLAPVVEASVAKRIVVDHHLNPSIEASVIISHPEKSSTSELVFLLLQALGYDELIGTESATCCCAGMMTDTGNFAYNSNDADIYNILARLIEKGVDKDALYVRLFNTNSLNRLRIMAYCQLRKMHVLPEHHCAVITLSRAELDEFNYQKGDTEALVNVPLSIPEVIYSIYLREDACDYVKVSMRSKGNFSVKNLCETYFGGGGHRNASGGEFHGSLTDAFECVLSMIPQCDKLIAEQNK